MGYSDAIEKDATLNRALGRRISHLRKTRGMTLEKLSASAGVSYQQMQKYEKGVNRMSAVTVYRLSKALGCDLARLFDGIEAEATAPDDDVAGSAEPVASDEDSADIGQLVRVMAAR